MTHELEKTWSLATKNAFIAAPEPRLIIDGHNFIYSAQKMVRRKSWFFTYQSYLSTAMQVWVAAMIRIAGPVQSLLLLKRGHIILFGGTILLCALLGYSLRGNGWDALGLATLVSCSRALQTYCLLIQYEILLCFFLTLFVYLLWKPKGRMRLFGVGLVISICAIIRPQFLLLLPLTILYLAWINSRSLEPTPTKWPWVTVLLGFSVIAVPWNVLYSLKLNSFYFFYWWERGYPLARSLNKSSTGVNFPFSETTGDQGLAFIFGSPIEYLKLLGRRFTYLIGYKIDLWYVAPWPIMWLYRVVKIPIWTALAFFSVAGVASIVIMAVRFLRHNRQKGVLLFLPIFAGLLPQLIINSSTRFIVPLIPLLILLQFGGLIGIPKMNIPIARKAPL